MRMTFSIVLAAAAQAAAQTCPGIEPMTLGHGLSAPARHSALFDEDGAGPGAERLFLSGAFTEAAGTAADGFVRWDGDGFTSVAGTPSGPKGAMRTFDDGTGLSVFVQGAPGVLHRYSGAGTWGQLSVPQFGGLDGSVESFAAFDPDNAGPRPLGLFALVHYAGLVGEENSVLWRYDEQGWYRLSGPVRRGEIIAYDPDHTGPLPWELYHWYNVDRSGRTVGYVWRLHQDHWEMVAQTSGGDELGFRGATVYHPDAAGVRPPLLVFTGGFNNVRRPGGPWILGNRAMVWDGSTISTYPAVWPTRWEGNNVGVYYDSSTPRLIFSGRWRPYYIPTLWESRWNGIGTAGAPWQAFATGGNYGPHQVVAGDLTVIRRFDPDGAGPRRPQLVISGDIAGLGGEPARNFGAWQPSGTGGYWLQTGLGPSGPVLALHVFNDGSGRRLFAGGQFLTVGTEFAGNVARWSGSAWEPLGRGLALGVAPAESRVSAMTVMHDGLGWGLYAAAFWKEGAGPYSYHSNVARWDGENWSLLPGGGVSSYTNHEITSLAAYDSDGTGPEPTRLFAGGRFAQIGGVAANGLAYWNGQGWSAVPGFVSGNVNTLKVLDDGVGPALYIGGSALRLPGLSHRVLLRMGPAGFEAYPAPLPSVISATEVYDVAIDQTSGVRRVAVAYQDWNRYNVARWTGGAWQSLEAPINEYPRALRGYEEGGAPLLLAGRMRFNGVQWSFRPGPFGEVRAISPLFDDGGGPAFYYGGGFTHSMDNFGNTVATGRVARVRLCAAPAQGACYANCDGSGATPVLNVADLTCFLQRYAAGDPWANCDQSTGAPVLNVADFTCFLQRFAAGCSEGNAAAR